jgi:hypothetical protein
MITAPTRGYEMLRHTMTIVAAVALTSAIVAGQAAQAPVPSKPAETPAAAQPPRPQAQLVNVRLDFTVTEQRGGTTLEPKTVTMLVADRESGRVRTGGGNALLNVDARPELTRDGRIRLVLSLEYRRQAEEMEKIQPALLSQSMAMIMDDGKAAVVSQSADPTAGRTTVRVEAKATILK